MVPSWPSRRMPSLARQAKVGGARKSRSTRILDESVVLGSQANEHKPRQQDS